MSPLQKAAISRQNREADVRSRRFPVASRTTSVQRQKDILKKQDAKIFRELVKPENTHAILDALPREEGDRLHGITCGDFIYMDLIIGIIHRLGPPRALKLATLSVSTKNLEQLARVMTQYPHFPVHVILSHYFQCTSKDVFLMLEKTLVERFPTRFTLSMGRSHAKIACFDYGDHCFVIEGSANLRSSKSIENLAIFRDRELHAMHTGWMDEFHTAFLAAKAESEGSTVNPDLVSRKMIASQKNRETEN